MEDIAARFILVVLGREFDFSAAQISAECLMATDAEFVAFLIDQMAAAGKISSRKMFGEYAIYMGAKVVALVCDNQLFVKPTTEGRAYIGRVEEAAAYPDAKPSFLIREKFEDADWLAELIRITERALPAPKARKNTKAAPSVVKKRN